MTSSKNPTPQDYEHLTVEHSLLHFDLENPRDEPQENEENIRKKFGLEDYTYNLARHISKHGQNPTDVLAVVQHPDIPGHYVVKEGNRRLCAIQLLNDPERAPDNNRRKRYRKLRDNFDYSPSQVSVVLFYSEDDARVWMSVKHEGQQEGVGTRTWDAAQKARFNLLGPSGSKNQNLQSNALLTYAVNKGLITQQQLKSISISTVARYLPSVRGALALVNNKDCRTNARIDEFNTALTHFLEDAHQGELSSRSRAKDWKEYAENLRARGISPQNRDQAEYDPSSTNDTSAPAAEDREESKRGGRGPSNPGKRKYLIPRDFKVILADIAFRKLVEEGKQLHPDSAPFSCNYLTRVILERLVFLYAKKHGIGSDGGFSAVVERVLAHAKKSNNKPSKGVIGNLKKAADKTSRYSYEVMSNAIHGEAVPSGLDVRTHWDTLQSALEYLQSAQH